MNTGQLPRCLCLRLRKHIDCPWHGAEAEPYLTGPLAALAGRYDFKHASSWYRSLTPDGKTWCETSDPEECYRETHPTEPLTYERLDRWTITAPWRRWLPPTLEVDQTEEGA